MKAHASNLSLLLSNRAAFQGVGQIMAFNWPFYLSAMLSLLAGITILTRISSPTLAQTCLIVGLSCTAFWTIASVLASLYVYDVSPLYRWAWLTSLLDRPAGSAVNIHAGLDESSAALRQLFPELSIVNWDIYDPELMTEASIARARRKHPTEASEQVRFDRLPALNKSIDLAFLIFSAHELRERVARETLFIELDRILKPGAEVILAEHMRDWRNFLVYGPGCFHFFSLSKWRRLIHRVGWTEEHLMCVTPFVRIFHLRKSL